MVKFVTMRTPFSELKPGDLVFVPTGNYKLPKVVIGVKGNKVHLKTGSKSLYVISKEFWRVVNTISDVIR